MFDLSLTEILIVVVVGVIFIGPKDLPVVLRAVAKGMAQLRVLWRELKITFDEVARETGLNETKDEINREMRLITGDDGKKYESYDISDFLPPEEDKPVTRTPAGP